MKFYSELTNKVYDTEKACMKAEQEYKQALEAKKREEEMKKLAEKKKQEKRAEDAKRVEVKREAMIKAQCEYREELEKFCKEYGSYHFTTNSFDGIPHLFEFLGL
jgi:hypothetical protein